MRGEVFSWRRDRNSCEGHIPNTHLAGGQRPVRRLHTNPLSMGTVVSQKAAGQTEEQNTEAPELREGGNSRAPARTAQ